MHSSDNAHFINNLGANASAFNVLLNDEDLVKLAKLR